MAEEKTQIRRIVDASDDLLDILTGWMYDWWGREEGYSFEAVRCYMQHSMNAERLAQTYGLFLDDTVVGMYQFTYCDLEVRPDIYPWLANVYIHPEYRGRGLGRILLKSVRQSAVAYTDFHELFLFTRHEGLYERYGWERVGELDTFTGLNRIQHLYRLELREGNASPTQNRK